MSAFPPLPSRASLVGYRLTAVVRGRAVVWSLDGVRLGTVECDYERKVWIAYGPSTAPIEGGPWGTQHLAATALAKSEAER